MVLKSSTFEFPALNWHFIFKKRQADQTKERNSWFIIEQVKKRVCVHNECRPTIFAAHTGGSLSHCFIHSKLTYKNKEVDSCFLLKLQARKRVCKKKLLGECCFCLGRKEPLTQTKLSWNFKTKLEGVVCLNTIRSTNHKP